MTKVEIVEEVIKEKESLLWVYQNSVELARAELKRSWKRRKDLFVVIEALKELRDKAFKDQQMEI